MFKNELASFDFQIYFAVNAWSMKVSFEHCFIRFRLSAINTYSNQVSYLYFYRKASIFIIITLYLTCNNSYLASIKNPNKHHLTLQLSSTKST